MPVCLPRLFAASLLLLPLPHPAYAKTKPPYIHKLTPEPAFARGERDLLDRLQHLQQGVEEGRGVAVPLSHWGLTSSLNTLAKHVM